MPELHVVTGAGPVGTAVAEQLAAQGHAVRVLTRSGSGPAGDRIDRRSVDIETDDLHPHLDGAAAIYHCTHVAYDNSEWRAKLPGMEARVLDAAGTAVVAFPESLYSYGHLEGAITEASPRTATHRKLGVRTALLAARDRHAAPTVSVAASDFYGPRVMTAHMGDRVIPNILAGKTIRVLADADLPHAFTYVPDLAAALVTAAATPSTWNSVLHAPTAPAVTQREMIEMLSAAAGLPTPKIGVIPSTLVRLFGVVPGSVKEIGDTLYQFRHPFLLDSTHSERVLGLAPTPLADGAAATMAWWQAAVPAVSA